MTRTKANAFLLMIFLMIPSLTHPLKLLFNSGIPVYAATVIIVGISLFLNRNSLFLNKNFIIFSITITILYFINFISVDYKDIVIFEFIEFLKFGFIAAYLAYQEFSFDELKKAWLVTGIVNIGMWIITLDSVMSRTVSYMFFGNTMIYSYVIITYSLFFNKYANKSHKKKVIIKCIEAITTILIGILLLIFAHRGAILTAIIVNIFLMLRLIWDNRQKYNMKIIVALITSVIFFASIIDVKKIILNSLELTRVFLVDMGLNSYSIRKFILLIEEGFATASSGRDDIYILGWNIAKQSAFPRGVGFFKNSTGLIYPHNFLIDLYIILGYIVGTIFLIGLFYLLISSYKKKDSLKNDLLTLLIIISMTKLLLSSSFVFETSFWAILAIITRKNYNYTMN